MHVVAVQEVLQKWERMELIEELLDGEWMEIECLEHDGSISWSRKDRSTPIFF